MTFPQEWSSLVGMTAVASDGGKLGKVGQIYLDEATGEPEWVTVRTGLLGTRESFAPLRGAVVRDEQLVLAVTGQLVSDAPSIESDGRLEEAEVAALYQHYSTGEGGAGYGEDSGRLDVPETTGQAGEATGPGAGDAMTRSEERLRVGTESVPVGRARLRKYVVTEHVTTTVPVSHEEVRVEREPITDADREAALSGPDITEGEHEVTLRAERPVVAKEAVPVERVRLTTEQVAGEEQVTEQVRKEQIDEPEVERAPEQDH